MWESINHHVLPGGSRYYDIEEFYNRMIRSNGIPMGYMTGVQNSDTPNTPQSGSPESEPDEEISLDNSDIGDNYYTENHNEVDRDELDLI